ncbi:unnamed protein product, partial [Amoebophrya sp. A25]
ACERDLQDFSGAIEAINLDLEEQKTRMESLQNMVAARMKAEERIGEQVNGLQSGLSATQVDLS